MLNKVFYMVKRINHKDFGFTKSIIVEPMNIPEWKQTRQAVKENSQKAMYAAERHNRLSQG